MLGPVVLLEELFALGKTKEEMPMGHSRASDVEKRGILKEGVNFISKPFSPYDLLRKVRKALDS